MLIYYLSCQDEFRTEERFEEKQEAYLADTKAPRQSVGVCLQPETPPK